MMQRTATGATLRDLAIIISALIAGVIVLGINRLSGIASVIISDYRNNIQYLLISMAWIVLWIFIYRCIFRRKLISNETLDRLEFFLVSGSFLAIAALYALWLWPWRDLGEIHLLLARIGLAAFCSILPGSLYYLFLVMRRENLLNGYLVNLHRLNLLRPRDSGAETQESRSGRINTYLEAFESSYGRIRPEFKEKIIENTANSAPPEASNDSFDISMRISLPVVYVTILCTLGWLLAMLKDSPTNFVLSPALEPVVFGFLGSYAFGLNNLIWRFNRGDLSVFAYLGLVKKIILGMLFVWVVGNFLIENAVASLGTILMLCFAIGGFPLVAWEFIASVLKRYLPLPTLKDRMPLDMIDGINILHQSRLEEEDINNVQNMATCNLVKLLATTRFTTHRLMDWIDQAILLCALGAEAEGDFKFRRRLLSAYGIRSATALHAALERKAIPENGKIKLHDDTVSLNSWAAALLATISISPNFKLVATWKDGFKSNI